MSQSRKPKHTLAIELSNPGCGPSGRVDRGARGVLHTGPGVALGTDSADMDWADPILARSPIVENGVELLQPGAGLNADLLPAIERLLERCGAAVSDLGRIAVSIGPGNREALTLAVDTAKALAHASGASIVAVPSWRVAAWCLPFSSAPAVVCLVPQQGIVHGALLPLSPSEGGWWARTGRSALERLVEPFAFGLVERNFREGRKWLGAACELGPLEPSDIEALQPATLIADARIPPAFAEMATRLGINVIEPIFTAHALLRLSQRAPPVAVEALTPR